MSEIEVRAELEQSSTCRGIIPLQHGLSRTGLILFCNHNLLAKQTINIIVVPLLNHTQYQYKNSQHY